MKSNCSEYDIFGVHRLSPEPDTDWLCGCGAPATIEQMGGLFCNACWSAYQGELKAERDAEKQQERDDWAFYKPGGW